MDSARATQAAILTPDVGSDVPDLAASEHVVLVEGCGLEGEGGEELIVGSQAKDMGPEREYLGYEDAANLFPGPAPQGDRRATAGYGATGTAELPRKASKPRADPHRPSRGSEKRRSTHRDRERRKRGVGPGSVDSAPAVNAWNATLVGLGVSALFLT